MRDMQLFNFFSEKLTLAVRKPLLSLLNLSYALTFHKIRNVSTLHDSDSDIVQG